MPKPTLVKEPVEIDQRNLQLYLPPSMLVQGEANQKARPTETPEQRAARVAKMAHALYTSRKQNYPVLAVEVFGGEGEANYEYVDGGARVDAIQYLIDREAEFPDIEQYGLANVWVSLLDPSTDLFQTAFRSNLDREGVGLMDMAMAVREAKDRNGFKGVGAGNAVAEYLGIPKSRVSEYEKILRGPEKVKAMIRSGEISSLDVALKIMANPEEAERTAQRAQQLAEEEAQERASKGKKGRKGGGSEDEPVEGEPAAPAPIKAKHAARAAREGGARVSRTSNDLAEWFGKISLASHPERAVKYAEAYAGWKRGKVSDKKWLGMFDAAVGADKVVKPAKVSKPAKPPVKKTAKKAAKPAKKKAPKAAKVAKKTVKKKSKKAPLLP